MYVSANVIDFANFRIDNTFNYCLLNAKSTPPKSFPVMLRQNIRVGRISAAGSFLHRFGHNFFATWHGTWFALLAIFLMGDNGMERE